MLRSLAALLALMSIGLAFHPSRRRLSRSIAVGLGVGLAILSHLEWGILAAIGVSLAYLTRDNFITAIQRCIAAGASASLVIAPWIVLLVSRHGLDPFLSSSSASDWSIVNFAATLVFGGMFGLLLWPALLGVFVAIRAHQWFLVAWTPLIVLTTPRMDASAGFAIPAALLAGIGIGAAAYFLAGYKDREIAGVHGPSAEAPLLGIWRPAVYLLLAMSLVLVGPLRSLQVDPSIDVQLDEGERNGMKWIRTHSPPEARFVVISAAETWWSDRVAEWFPLLAGRPSLTTVQGLEWAGPGVFTKRRAEIERIKRIQWANHEQLPEAVREACCSADFVALFLPRNDETRIAFAKAPEYRLVYRNSATAVIRLTRSSPLLKDQIPHQVT